MQCRSTCSHGGQVRLKHDRDTLFDEADFDYLLFGFMFGYNAADVSRPRPHTRHGGTGVGAHSLTARCWSKWAYVVLSSRCFPMMEKVDSTISCLALNCLQHQQATLMFPKRHCLYWMTFPHVVACIDDRHVHAASSTVADARRNPKVHGQGVMLAEVRKHFVHPLGLWPG